MSDALEQNMLTSGDKDQPITTKDTSQPLRSGYLHDGPNLPQTVVSQECFAVFIFAKRDSKMAKHITYRKPFTYTIHVT